ncbi:tyrosine-type recombinase/integrase [Mycolicibacterium sp. 050158]|uniref:tyrosine-type recombinase/integrase n=1 Tax=Mycolicibacterium sp. 050158 TaxID=3090602 RepID=UPI00299F144C|nr:tyrosine-type recombinase/integrase [Mycolicibacterium sp. 050158]MDX1888864.1 tyrosine-type recombinase/integrase [Mycolicibacterium sp. 050158]
MAWVKARQRKDGSVYFCVYFRELNHTTGQTAQTSLSWDNPNDAEHCRSLIDQVGPEKAREILRIVQTPGQVQTVRQFLLKHIDHLTGVEQGTLARYRSYVRNDIGPALGDIPLTALTRDHVARWIAAMAADGKSGKTVANKHGFLAGALNVAVRDGHLKSNPCDGNRLPRWDREDMTFLEPTEFQLLLAHVTEYWRPLVEFLVASGARWSEATALKPADVDRVAGTVRIRRAWKTGAGGYTLGVPKTKKSVRTINVAAATLEHLDYTGEWLFTNSGRGRHGDVNAPVRIHSFNPNVWTPAVARARAAGLTKKPRVHDLRHTCASWLIQSGRPLPAVQQHLGHESIQTTVGVYGHLDRSSGRDNADVIGRMLGRS